MNLRIKKGIVMAGIILFSGGMAFTSQAAFVTSVNFSIGDQDVKAHASGNINSSKFYYEGHRTGSYSNKYAVARMDVQRAWYVKSYESGKKLESSSFSKSKNAAKKDEEGIRIDIRTYDSNGKSVTHSNMRVMRCR